MQEYSSCFDLSDHPSSLPLILPCLHRLSEVGGGVDGGKPKRKQGERKRWGLDGNVKEPQEGERKEGGGGGGGLVSRWKVLGKLAKEGRPDPSSLFIMPPLFHSFMYRYMYMYVCVGLFWHN